MKILFISLLLALSAAAAYCQKILIVSTNVATANNAPNGTFLMEIAYPFAALTKAGLDFDIVTPKGGKAALYHQGTLADDLKEISDSAPFKQKTENTLSPAEIKTENYAGIYYPGGGGQFYDVVDNEQIAAIAAKIYERGGILGAAGHGAASLVNIKTSSGEYIVRNTKLTCFPKAYSAKWLPFDWESLLRQRGAEVMLPVTAVEKDKGVMLVDESHRMVTGSYAENTQWVAEQMVKLIQSKQK